MKHYEIQILESDGNWKDVGVVRRNNGREAVENLRDMTTVPISRLRTRSITLKEYKSIISKSQDICPGCGGGPMRFSLETQQSQCTQCDWAGGFRKDLREELQ